MYREKRQSFESEGNRRINVSGGKGRWRNDDGNMKGEGSQERIMR